MCNLLVFQERLKPQSRKIGPLSLCLILSPFFLGLLLVAVSLMYDNYKKSEIIPSKLPSFEDYMVSFKLNYYRSHGNKTKSRTK